MDEIRLEVLKEIKTIICPVCSHEMMIAFYKRDGFENKTAVEEIRKHLLQKMDSHKTLYLRDTSSPLIKFERIRVLMWNEIERIYVEIGHYDPTLKYTREWIIETIRGVRIKEGFEFIDIYGFRNNERGEI